MFITEKAPETSGAVPRTEPTAAAPAPSRPALTLSAGAAMPWSWHAMAAIGLAMIAVFAFVRLGPYARLARAVAAADWPAGAAALASVRKGVVVNLALGVLVVAIAVLKP